MAAEVRYTTTSDGVRIAYSVEGDGPPLLVVPPAYTSFSLMHELPSYSRLLQRVREGRTLIQYDPRGAGLSEREISLTDGASLVRDVIAVLDALGIDRLSVFGAGPTGTIALQFAISYPPRVAAQVLFGTMVRVTDLSFFEGMITMFRGNWPAAARTLAGANLRHPPDDAARIVPIYQRSISGELAAKYMEDSLSLDLGPYLGDITARTLVMHSQDDALYPFSQAQEMAAGIRGARLLPIEGNKSIMSLGDKTDTIANAIVDFLDQDPETRRRETAATRTGEADLRTVLFTDLVGHTEMMQRLGDERGRDVLREHERITRETLKAHGGTEVKTMGDGFMASFGSVTRAVECAITLQRAIEQRNTGANPNDVGAQHPRASEAISSTGQHGSPKSPLHAGNAAPDNAATPPNTPPVPLNVRVGLNAGEPIEEDGDLFGATVILASRIAARANAGEILVSDTVRGLCSGKGFLFSDRGEFVAKGFEDPVRIYAVNWRD